MQTINAVNACLATMGIAPVNSLSGGSRLVGSALTVVKAVDEEVQAAGWWFNTEQIELYPDATDGRIYVPDDFLSFRPQSNLRVAQRGRVLYNRDTADDAFTESVKGSCIRQVAFEDIPARVAAYISAYAAERFQTTYDGDSTKTRTLQINTNVTKLEALKDRINFAAVNLHDESTAIQLARRFRRWVR